MLCWQAEDSYTGCGSSQWQEFCAGKLKQGTSVNCPMSVVNGGIQNMLHWQLLPWVKSDQFNSEEISNTANSKTFVLENWSNCSSRQEFCAGTLKQGSSVNCLMSVVTVRNWWQSLPQMKFDQFNSEEISDRLTLPTVRHFKFPVPIRKAVNPYLRCSISAVMEKMGRDKTENIPMHDFLCGAAQTFFQCSMEWFILLLCKAFVFSPFPEFLPSKKLLQPHNHTLIWNCTLKNKSVANGQVQLRNNHYHEQNLSGTASKCILYVPDFCHHSNHWNVTTTALLM